MILSRFVVLPVSLTQKVSLLQGFCGDIDIVGHQKPQAYFRRVLWNNSKLEMAVHRPIPPGKKEIVGPWGWPEELQSWTWPSHAGSNMSLRVFSQLAPFITVRLNDQEVGKGSVNVSTLVADFEVPFTPGNLTVQSFASAKEQLESARNSWRPFSLYSRAFQVLRVRHSVPRSVLGT